MGFQIPLELKSFFINTARSLREGHEDRALQQFNEFAAQNFLVAHRIHGRLWQLMDQPESIDIARHALWTQPGLAPTNKKIQAIEEVYNALLDEYGYVAPPPPSIPENVKRVEMPAFFDCGFDPRFSEDGEYLLPTAKKGRLVSFIEWVASIVFSLRAYLSLNPDERALRQMVLSLAKTEKAWTNCTEYHSTDIYHSHEFDNVRIYEREFLTKASNCYKAFHPQPNAPWTLYPRELLDPIHKINKPQAEQQRAKHLARPGWQNADLSRIGTSGFWRLGEGMYTIHTRSGRIEHLDKHAFKYVPHYIFIHAIEESANRLKIAMRTYRSTIASMSTDIKCTKSFAAFKEKLLRQSEDFNNAWNAYVNSHELVKEVQETFSTIDPYKQLYDHEKRRWETTKPLSHAELSQITRKEDSPTYWKERYESAGYEMLRELVKSAFPDSLNGRMLLAYDETSAL